MADIFKIMVTENDRILTITSDAPKAPSKDMRRIGTQYDDGVQELLFERPTWFADSNLRLLFSVGGESLAPIDLGTNNRYTIPLELTQTLKLGLQVGFISDGGSGKTTEWSNILMFDLRESLSAGNKPVPPWPGITYPTEEETAQMFETHNTAPDAHANLQVTINASSQIANRIYKGVNLTTTFADEIAGHSDVWAWMTSRIQSADFTGLNIGDHIPFVVNGRTIRAEVAGIDTYYRCGSPAIGHHVDFISRDCYFDAHAWNKAGYNNGIAGISTPWLCSDIYAWLNGLKMDVPNVANADPTTEEVDYTSNGVYSMLPTELADVIVPKIAYIPARYTAGSLLSDDNGVGWQNIGKLWLPSEFEVCGYEHMGTKSGYSSGSVQYPIFKQATKRIKGSSDGGGNSAWWLISARSGNSNHSLFSSSSGFVSSSSASGAGIRVPICFRIA